MNFALEKAAAADERLSAVGAALLKEKQDHQRTREDHAAEYAEITAKLEVAARARDAEMAAHAATKDQLAAHKQQSEAAINALQARIDLLTVQMQQGIQAAAAAGLVPEVKQA